ncbi:helix-turn-helix domain-containing protein [Microbacterium sp. NPDC091313]
MAAPEAGLYRTASHTIGAVQLGVVRLPTGVTPLRAHAAPGVRLVLPIDEALVLRTPDGRELPLGTQDLTWVPVRQQVSMMLARPASVAFVDVRAELFARHNAALSALPSRTHPASPLVRPVREFVLCALADRRPIEPISAHLFARMVVDMIELLALEAQGSPHGAGPARPSLHSQAMAHIAARRGDAELSPSSLARALCVSVRQLQRAFEEHGSTVASEIRRQRTDAAVAMLSDAAFDGVKMPEIAARAGFGNDAEMRRAIAAWMGTTPSQLRGADERPPAPGSAR